MLIYKAELVGIQVKITEESYTSQASFLDADPLPVYGDGHVPAFSGRRVKRGLYRAADGRPINADVNGSYNIIRTVLPDAFGKGIAGAAGHPVRGFPYARSAWRKRHRSSILYRFRAAIDILRVCAW
jgi:transposase